MVDTCEALSTRVLIDDAEVGSEKFDPLRKKRAVSCTREIEERTCDPAFDLCYLAARNLDPNVSKCGLFGWRFERFDLELVAQILKGIYR